MIQSQNPTTGVVGETFPPLTPDQIASALHRADRAQRAHKATSFAQRGACLIQLATLLLAEKNRYAALITHEMGKPLSQAIAEVEKCAAACAYYAAEGESLLAPRREKNALVRYDPLGLILAVMPWNFPFWQVIRCAAPVLMAGNGFLLKHASNVPQCALAIQDLFVAAGFIPNLFQTVLVEKDAVAAIIADDRIRGATLTGSEAAGASLASLAGAALKPTVLELGGSDPLIIMPSADLDRAAEAAVQARMLNTGQSCIAAKRFLIHSDVYDAVVQRILAHVDALKVGNPMDPNHDLGPLATEGIRLGLWQDVQATLAAGAKALRTGGPTDGPGFFYTPTVLAEIPMTSPAARKELFGPVVSLYRIQNKDEALNVANSTPYGLGASVWTEEETEKTFFADGLDAGSITFNGMVRSDPALPFGGVKASGYGRELGPEGIRSFTNMKTLRGFI
jgi:succinate-semialdehyde dehydrogenase/glutarate-semialdehyde dehydrogenase